MKKFIFFISQENVRIQLNLQPLSVTVKGSEKNDPNLRNGILDKSLTPLILKIYLISKP